MQLLSCLLRAWNLWTDEQHSSARFLRAVSLRWQAGKQRGGCSDALKLASDHAWS